MVKIGLTPVVAGGAWREGGWIAAGQFIGAFGSIAGVRLLTSVLAPESYGQLTLALTLASLALQVTLGPLVNASERFFTPARETGQTSAFFTGLRRLTLSASALIAAIGIITGVVLFTTGRVEWVPLAAATVLFALTSGCETILDSVQNATRQRKAVALHQAVRFWLRPVLAVELATVLGPTSWVGLLAYCVASIPILCSQFWFLRRTLRRLQLSTKWTNARSAVERRMLAYAAPLGMWGLFTWMQMWSDRWVLQVFGSSSDVGLYTSVAQLGSYPLLLGAILSQFAAPLIYAQAGTGADRRRAAAAVRMCELLAVGVAGVAGLLTLTAMLMHERLFALVVGAQYQSVSVFLPVAVLSGGLFVVGQMLSLVPLVLGDSRSLLLPRIGTAVLALILNIGGAYVFGFSGVLWAGVLVSVSYVVWLTLVVRRVSGRLSSAVETRETVRIDQSSWAEASA
jgi:O-antigen/teichoic acid export membrane protein